MEEPLRIIAATQGSYILNDTSEFTGSFDGIVVLEDTIISSIIIDGDDVTNDYIADKLLPVKLGAIIRPVNNTNDAKRIRFNSVQLVSGSVAIIL